MLHTLEARMKERFPRKGFPAMCRLPIWRDGDLLSNVVAPILIGLLLAVVVVALLG